MCLYMWDDIEVHEKLSSLNDGKDATFDLAIDVFLLAVCSPIFCCMSSVKLSQAMANWEN